APALALRGRLALDQGQYADAESWLRQALDADPNNCVARYNLTSCLLALDKADEARKQELWSKQIQDDLARYDRIISHQFLEKPHNAALHCELGQLLLRLGRIEEGRRWLDSALREDPAYAPALKALAEQQAQSKQ